MKKGCLVAIVVVLILGAVIFGLVSWGIGIYNTIVSNEEGVNQGFNEAMEAFGGWLPDISYDTLDTVMEKLDAWAADADGNE